MGSGEAASSLAGLFLKRNGVIRPVLLTGDSLPGGAGTVPSASVALATFDLGENGSVAIVLPSVPRGVLLYEESGLHWLVRESTIVPGMSLSDAGFRGVKGLPKNFMDPLLLDGNRVLCQASLPDRSAVLLLADQNGVQGIKIGDFFWDAQASGGAVVFNDFQIASLFRAGSLTTVASLGDALDGHRITEIQEIDVNSRGDVILAIEVEKDSQREPQILGWSASSGLKTLISTDSIFPGPSLGTPGFFTHLTLAETGNFSFIADFGVPAWGNSRPGGIYIFDQGTITKVVADGDPGPLGGTIWLGSGLDGVLIDGPPPPHRIFYDAVATRELDIAFTAYVGGINQGGVFIWSGGSLVPVVMNNQEIEGLDAEQTERLEIEIHEKPAVIAAGPRLLVIASTLDYKRYALLSASSVGPTRAKRILRPGAGERPWRRHNSQRPPDAGPEP